MTATVDARNFAAVVKTGKALAKHPSIRTDSNGDTLINYGTLPVLCNVMIICADSTLAAISTDLERKATAFCHAATPQEFAVTIPAYALWDYLRALDIRSKHEYEITLAYDGNLQSLTISCTTPEGCRTKATFKGIDAREFPENWPELPDMAFKP